MLASYRGSILDILIIAANLGLDPRATGWIIAQVRDAPDERTRGVLIGILAALRFVLPAAAAVLKRRRTHARLAAQAKAEGVESIRLEPGCLFSPIVYLAVNLVLGSAIMTGLGPLLLGLAPLLLGDEFLDSGLAFVPLILLVVVASVAQTGIVYRYFQPPEKPRRGRSQERAGIVKFLESPASELLGDACIFVTTLLFQTVWLTLASTPFTRVTGVEDVVGRLFFVIFAALLVYFPPRMLYLVEELRRPAARVTLLLANAAMVYRLFMGGP